MLSSAATRCGHPPGVHPTPTSNPTPPTLLLLPPTCFPACPTQHGLGRTSLKSSNDEKLLQAIISSISCRLEKLSLSDDTVLGSPASTVYSPVYTATPVGTHSTPSQNPVRPRLVYTKAQLFERLSNGVKAGLYRSIKKRGDLKKRQAPIPAPSGSQCSLIEQQYSRVGQRDQARGSLSMSDSVEANPNSQAATIQEPFVSAVQGNTAQRVTNPTFPQPWSSDTSPLTSTSTVWALGDEVTDDSMDEDEQPLSPRTTSPTPMDLEASSPSSDATGVPESPQTTFEVSAGRDGRDPVPEPTDEVMSDGEEGASDSEGHHQTEPSDMMTIDSPSTESVSSTVFSQEINMGDAEDPTPSTSFEPPTTPSGQLARDVPASNECVQLATPATNPDPAPAPDSSPNVAASEDQSSSTQPLPTSGEVHSVASQPNATSRQVAIVQPPDSAPAPTANATQTSAVDHRVTVSPASAPTSTARPSTPTPSSSSRNSSQMPGEPANGHASRVHQVLSKLRLSKQAPDSNQTSTNDEASEEAEASAFFVNLLKRTPRRDLPMSQSAPTPPTRANANQRKSSNPTSSSLSQQQTATVIRSTAPSHPAATKASSPSIPTQPTHQCSLPPVAGRQTNPQPSIPSSVVANGRYVVASPSGRAPATVSAAGKVPSSSSTILPTQQASFPVVAGRQNGPNSPRPPSVIGIGRQVAAQPSGRAPCTVSATDKVNGPPGSFSAGAGTSSEAHQPSSAGMDGIEPGQRPIKGSGRVARAIRKTGLTWQIVQQNAQRNQAALDTAQSNAAASTAMSALERDLEERLSQEWHAAQPRPPPEAIPYITTGEEYEGDENDDEAMLDWLLGQKD